MELSLDQVNELVYVLRFALTTIARNELEETKSKENWKLGKSIEEQISILVK